MYELLKELCSLNGVSGNEEAVREYIRKQVEPYADSIHTDLLGNLIVSKRGERSGGRRVLLAAHMDEVGLIVTRITEKGYLKFSFVGGVDRRVALGKRVVLGPNQVKGVICIKAIHLFQRKDEEIIPDMDSLYIDIGAKDKKEAEEMVTPGTYGYFRGAFEQFGDGMVKGKAMDDRVGCAVMMMLLREQLPLDVTFVFTAQEEIGSCGAYAAAFSCEPDIVLILEGTTAADQMDVPEHKRVCALGKGPVLLYMDYDAIYDRPLFETLRELAEQNRISWQTKEYLAGGNDACGFQCTKSGTRVAAVAAPIRYLHAPNSVGKLSDFHDMLRLARLFLERMAEETLQKEDGYGTV